MAVNTAVGLTDRVNVERVLTQGGVFGSLKCSNSIDTIGKKCFNSGEHLFTYKKIVKIMPLSMVDDILAVARCRIGKGLGIITDIMKMLEKVKFGPHYFQKALFLRESLFLNSILTNSGVWYCLTDVDIKNLEDLDLSLLRKVLNAPFSVPPEGVYLELGCLNINTLIKAKRVNYLHYLISQSENTMLGKFFNAQLKYSSKNDWTEQVKTDLKDFGISDEMSELKGISNLRFKKLVK